MPDISVVIPTHNRADRLPRLLRALHGQTLSSDRFEVILVDDCSADKTWATITSLAGEVPLQLKPLRTPASTGGPATPRNVGWRVSAAPTVAFLDDDCLPEPEWLESGLAGMEANPGWGVMQGCTLPPPGTEVCSLPRWCVWRSISGATPWFEAANIFYRRRALEEAGGFNEDFATWGEDTDLGWKVVDAGWGRGFAAGAVAIHEIEQRGWRHAARFALLDRNLIQVAAAHPRLRQEGFWRPWAIHRQSVEFLVAILGLAVSCRWRPAALLAAPYLWWRGPSIRTRGFARELTEVLAVDAARCAGHLAGSISNRVIVL